MGLSAAEVKFLTALSDLELKRLKEVNWNPYNELKSQGMTCRKNTDQMQDAANNFSKHLINVVEEYESRMNQPLRIQRKKDLIWINFAGTATLGISLAMPQLTLLSAATGIGRPLEVKVWQIF